MSARRVVMSGMRPTGRLQLGNYWGALRNWVALQDAHSCYFCVVDWHMLTTGYEDTSRLQEHARDMVLDWLAAGLDPERSILFRQSDVPEHAELALMLSMITPLSWLENNPTWKEQLQELSRTKREKMLEAAGGGAAATATLEETEARAELRTHGFLGYPVLQAADILLYGGELIPVGKDQLPHVELAREIARRFNGLYGRGRPVLVEPQPMLSPVPRVPGLDGRKMSKSYGNAVDLLESPESLKAKVQSMYTDPSKARAKDPGHPRPCPENEPGCAVFAFHELYGDLAARRETECTSGAIGCVPCKAELLQSMQGPFDEFRRARERFAARPGLVEEVLESGRRRAQAVAAKTMESVRTAMRLR